MSSAEVVDGFSLTNRLLLYASMLLTPAQFVSGMENNCPSNLGFLAFNWYNQIVWYRAAKAHQLHALSLLPIHFNTMFAITYAGGISSGNIFMGLILCFGTAGVLILNTVVGWISILENLKEGFGVYQFFFYGWRTLDEGWYKFMICWQVFNTLAVASTFYGYFTLPFLVADLGKISWYSKFIAIPVGSAVMLLASWPLILWTELIIGRNPVESATDWLSVWFFVAQVSALLLPSSSTIFGCIRGRKA